MPIRKKGMSGAWAKREATATLLKLLEGRPIDWDSLWGRAKKVGFNYPTFLTTVTRLRKAGLLKIRIKLEEEKKKKIVEVLPIPYSPTIFLIKELTDFFEANFEKLASEYSHDVFSAGDPIGIVLQDPLPTREDRIAKYINEEEWRVLEQAYRILREARRRFVLERLPEEKRSLVLEYEEKARLLVDKAAEIALNMVEREEEKKDQEYLETIKNLKGLPEYKEKVEELKKEMLKGFEETLLPITRKMRRSYREIVETWKPFYLNLVLSDADSINLFLRWVTYPSTSPGMLEKKYNEWRKSMVFEEKPKRHPLLDDSQLKQLHEWLKTHEKEYHEFKEKLENAPKIMFLTGEGWTQKMKSIRETIYMSAPEHHPYVVLSRKPDPEILKDLEEEALKRLRVMRGYLRQTYPWLADQLEKDGWSPEEIVARMRKDFEKSGWNAKERKEWRKKGIAFAKAWLKRFGKRETLYVCHKCDACLPDRETMLKHVEQSHPEEDDSSIEIHEKAYYLRLLQLLQASETDPKN